MAGLWLRASFVLSRNTEKIIFGRKLQGPLNSVLRASMKGLSPSSPDSRSTDDSETSAQGCCQGRQTLRGSADTHVREACVVKQRITEVRVHCRRRLETGALDAGQHARPCSAILSGNT